MGVEGHERLNWTVTTGTMSLLVVPASCHAVSRLLTAYHDNLNNPDDTMLETATTRRQPSVHTLLLSLAVRNSFMPHGP